MEAIFYSAIEKEFILPSLVQITTRVSFQVPGGLKISHVKMIQPPIYIQLESQGGKGIPLGCVEVLI